MLKRLFDIVLALVALVLLSPVMVVVAILIRWRLGSPVIFRQWRPGLHGRPFVMVKYRTMRDICCAEGKPLTDSERITPYGRFLRSTSLDELPEFWNVLKGDMSIVGPRPLLMEYLDYYTEKEMLRHSVRPGITGLAQVNGRNVTTWDERLAYDVKYIENHTLMLDLKILLKTFCQVLKRDGVVAVPCEKYHKLSDERSINDI